MTESQPMTAQTQRSDTVIARQELWQVIRDYWGQLTFTYFLFNVENLLRLLRPWLLGLAINDLLASSWRGMILLVTAHFLHAAIRTARQMYDTRVFTHIYATRAERIVIGQRGVGVDPSRVAARSTMSREFVEFFEHRVPVVLASLYSIIGATVILAFYDSLIVGLCAGLLAASTVLNAVYGKKTLQLSRLLHDQLEREVDVIDEAEGRAVHHHYRRIAGLRVRLSDWQAWNIGIMETFVLAAIAVALIRLCTLDMQAGSILAGLRYLMMFIMALDRVPVVVESISRLRDIGARITLSHPTQAASAGRST